MANGVAALLNVSRAVQALSLVGANIGVAKKKKISTKDIAKLGILNIVGVSLLKVQKDIAKSL